MRTAAGRCQALQHSCGLLLTSLAACLANAACLPPVCSGECEVQVPDCALRQGHRGVLRLGRARVATHRQHCSTPRRASPARAPAAAAVRPLFRCVHGPADCISCRLVASASRRPLEARALRQPATKARGQQHRQASTCLQPLGSVAAGRSRPWPGSGALSPVADAAAPGAAPLPRARGAPLLCAGRPLASAPRHGPARGAAAGRGAVRARQQPARARAARDAAHGAAAGRRRLWHAVDGAGRPRRHD